jgi:hypothetical protein
LKTLALLACLLLPCCARAIEIKVSAKALERTLIQQLFTADGRYYIRGDAHSACFVYAEDPKVSFNTDRIVVHVKAHAKLGEAMGSECLGVRLNTEADVSVVPDAQGESIGFRDPRIEKMSESKELNFLLVPFLSRKLPQQMKINAADLVRQLLATSTQSTGYDIKLEEMKIHSMQVAGDDLVVDLDGGLTVR